MATGAFAVPSMREICDSGEFDIVCLVTNPLRYQGGKPIITPARKFAEERGIVILEMHDARSQEFSDFLYLVRPNLLFVCDFGHILPKPVLKGAILGGINLHGSLLPKYRGAAPVHWAILNGETFTGVSIIHMTPQIDAGPVIVQSPPMPIGPRETVPELESRLAEFGAGIVLETVRKMAGDEQIRIIQQIDDKSSKAPRFKKEHGLVDWSVSSHDVLNHYRAMAEWPKSFTDWRRDDGTSTRLLLGPVEPLDDDFQELIDVDFSDPMFVEPIMVDAKMINLAILRAQSQNADPQAEAEAEQIIRRRNNRRPSWWKPGTVIRARDNDLIVAAGEGTVRILKIQPAGKKMMDVRDFLRGYPLKPGDHFGSSISTSHKKPD